MNFIDYIKTNGNKTFNEVPFNEVDNAILCQITYVSIENVINTNKSYTLSQLSNRYFSKYSDVDIKKDKSFIAKSPLVLREAGKARRFKDVLMHHFKVSFSENFVRQFAAMQFDLNDGTTYVSFRGTDDSILGWKEDFQMAYKKIEGFEQAKRYINLHCSFFKKYRVGGHSKGGALALYATLNSISFKRKNIIEVYSNDGPGIKREFIGNDIDKLTCKYIKIVPQDDIVGTIFDDDREHYVVKSDAFGFIQHDMFSWQVKDLSFIRCDSLDKGSIKLRKTINEYINKVPRNEVKKVSDSLFLFFKDANITKVSELFDFKDLNIINLFKSRNNIDENTFKILFNIVTILVKSRF